MTDKYFFDSDGTGRVSVNANWFLATGGTGGGTTSPTSSDNAIIDSNSAIVSTLVLANMSCINFTYGNSKGISGTGTLTITGNLSITQAGAVTATTIFKMAATSGTKTISSVASLPALTIDGAGGTFQLNANLTVTGAITPTNGIFDPATFNWSCASLALGSGTKTVKFGTGNFTVGSVATGTIFDFATNNTGLTVSASGSGSGGLFIPIPSGATATVALGTSVTYPVIFDPQGTATLTITGTTPTFTGMLLEETTTKFTAGMTVNTGTFTTNQGGSILTTSAGSAANINVTGTVVANNVTISATSFKDINASGSTIYAPNGTNVSGNTNIVFAAPEPGVMIVREM